MDFVEYIHDNMVTHGLFKEPHATYSAPIIALLKVLLLSFEVACFKNQRTNNFLTNAQGFSDRETEAFE